MNKKSKLVISSLIISLGLTGCSFSLNRDNKIIVKYDKQQEFNNDNKVDELVNIKEKHKRYLDYTYLIEESEYTNKTLAHVIDEKSISSENKKFDFKKDVDLDFFDDKIINSIELPKAFFYINFIV